MLSLRYWSFLDLFFAPAVTELELIQQDDNYIFETDAEFSSRDLKCFLTENRISLKKFRLAANHVTLKEILTLLEMMPELEELHLLVSEYPYEGCDVDASPFLFALSETSRGQKYLIGGRLCVDVCTRCPLLSSLHMEPGDETNYRFSTDAICQLIFSRQAVDATGTSISILKELSLPIPQEQGADVYQRTGVFITSRDVDHDQ